MGKSSNSKVSKTKNSGVDIKKLAFIIEQTLDSFGIVTRVMEVNNFEKEIEFRLDVALGTSLDSITMLHKDIGMAVASPTGDVKIIAPIPGKSQIAIIVPLGKFFYPNMLGKTEKYKIIRAETIVYRGVLFQLGKFLIGILKILSRLLDHFIRFLEEHF